MKNKTDLLNGIKRRKKELKDIMNDNMFENEGVFFEKQNEADKVKDMKKSLFERFKKWGRA